MRSYPVIAVTGLRFEARIAAGPNVRVVCSGDRRSFAASLRAAADEGCRGIISFGIAGGLERGLKAGTWVVASTVLAGGSRYQTDLLWSEIILKSHPGAVSGPIVGVDAPVAEPPAKLALQAETGAIAVDMESHVAAETAAARKLPFAAFRVVADPSHRRLPPAALGVTLADGSADIVAVLRSLARKPIQLPDLIGTALDTRRAKAALASSRRLLGPRFGLPDVGHHLLDVA